MAILDTLIIQLELEGSALTKGAAAAQQSLIGLEQQAEHTARTTSQALNTQLGKATEKASASFRRFRQEAMGALALFTGGRSLAGLGQEITQANEGLGRLAGHLGSLPAGMSGLHDTTQGLAPLSSLPDTPMAAAPTGDRESAKNGAGPSASTVPPAQATALADWAALLHQASATAQQALQEVEPTLHNAQLALARFTPLRPSSQTNGTSAPTQPGNLTHGNPAQNNPVPTLLDLSALLTARSIFNAGQGGRQGQRPDHVQPGPHMTETGQTARQTGADSPFMTSSRTGRETSPALENTSGAPRSRTAPPFAEGPDPAASAALQAAPGTGRLYQAPPAQPGMARDLPSHKGHITPPSPQWAELARSLHRLRQTLASQLTADSTTRPTTAQITPLSPALTRLVGQMDRAAPPRHVTTHNNTTHSPNIHITVEAGNAAPHDIARAVEAGAIRALNGSHIIA